MADSPLALLGVIRFHLSQLTAANGHHEFEHLARHLARARIYSNILPATGPVGAGGDGGRDFQTFRVHLDDPLQSPSGFAARSSGERTVAFACSLQAKIDGKIRSDLKTILAEGPVVEVVYFCETNVPIGRRRKLQASAANQGVELNIFDGMAIAEMLTDPEVFWIAQEYLRIPADHMPPRTEEAGWYERLRARWSDRTPVPFSQADFFDIKAGLRHATFEATAKPDLLGWMAKTEAFFDEITPRPLMRNALYELSVASLRGRGEMTSQTGRLRDYYDDVEEFAGLADLQDAATLLVYSFGALVRDNLDVDPDLLFTWRDRLLALIDAEMTVAPGPGRQSGLLQVRGHLGLLPPDRDTMPDPTVGYADWHRMLDIAEDAPLYPIEAFADFLGGALKWGVEQEALLALAARADELLQKRGGGPAGAKAVERAKTLMDQEHYIAAIRELHAAKARWFTGEHLDGLLNVFLLLGHCYQAVGLKYAAKYYALAAAYIASHEQATAIVRLQPDALHALADAEDAAGNSLGFLMTLLLAIDAHLRIDPDPMDGAVYPWVNANLSHVASLVSLVRRGQPDAEPLLTEPLAFWPEMFRDGVLALVDRPDADWNQGTFEDAWPLFAGAMSNRPFSDLGRRREVQWAALGLSWTVGFDNTYATTPIAEQFIAALQLALAAHAGIDLGLVPSDAILDFTIDDQADAFRVELDRDVPGGPRLQVVGPMRDRGAEQVEDTLAAIAIVLRQFTVLDDRVFVERLHMEMVGQIFVARPYPEMYRFFAPEALFFEVARRATEGFRRDLAWPIEPHADLAWFDGPGPTFDEQEALDSVAKRYQAIMPAIRHTLSAMIEDPGVYARLHKLHLDGLMDWEILAIVANIAMNARIEVDLKAGREASIAQAQAVMMVVETPETALRLNLFSDEAFEAHRNVYVGAHADSWRLRPPPAGFFRDLEKFLVGRYRMRDLDVEHEDFFGWPA
jgi:hypothetical protein